MRYQERDYAHLFTLRIRTHGGMVTINAYEAPRDGNGHDGHTRVDIEVAQNGEVIFERGQMWVGVPGHHTIDGDYAREAVIGAVAMRPGDTDDNYFADYAQAQLRWAEEYGEELSMERMYRYCDENGNFVGAAKARYLRRKQR